MDLEVVVDNSVLLARCLGPSIDAKAEPAELAFKTLETAGITPKLTESLHAEFETKLHERIGQILEAVRELAQATAPIPATGGDPLDLLEGIFARLRAKTEGSGAALLILETRISSLVREQGQLTVDLWSSLLNSCAAETIRLLAEVQRRFDLIGVQVIPQSKGIDQEPFRDVIAKTDLDHIASCAAFAASRKCVVLFVTFDGKLHGAREEILKQTANRVVVTAPIYLERQIKKQAE